MGKKKKGAAAVKSLNDAHEECQQALSLLRYEEDSAGRVSAQSIGDTISTDDQKAAFRLLKNAARRDHAEAQRRLGKCYFQGIGVAQNVFAAVGWYLKSAKNGNISAQRQLGCMYVHGEGVAANPQLGASWLRGAADAGCAWAANNLAMYYEQGCSE
jgi:TPR repeat protein